MLGQKTTILVAISGILTILGCICGVAPGVLLTAYPRLGLVAGLLVLILILLVIAAVVFQYKESDEFDSNGSTFDGVFHPRFVKRDKGLLIFISFLVLTTGTLLGVLCELLLKAVQATLAPHIVIGGVFLLILAVCVIILLVLGVNYSKRPISEHSELSPIVFEPKAPPADTRIKAQDGPQNTAARMNRDRPINQNDSTNNDYAKSAWPDSTFISSTKQNSTGRPPSSIQKEYQRLLQPSTRFAVNDKVYVNDRELAQIIEADGLGNYRLQYLADGRFDSKNGAALRKALPMIT